MYTNSRYDPSHRRRRRHPHQNSPLQTAASLATAAALAYGAYCLGSWAWNSLRPEQNEPRRDENEEDISYEWTDEKHRGRNVAIEDDSPRSSYRSRRSRADWSETNHRRRSHRPSPLDGYQHHNDEEGARDGRVREVLPIVRNSRMARCRTETSRAMMDFLPTLKKAVANETDVGVETEELKRLRVRRRERNEGGDLGEEERKRERELWNVVKNKSITRLVTTVYAHNIVFLVLTVQVNLLGGRLLREEDGDGTGEQQPDDDRYRSSHQTVLAKTYQHVFSKGLPSLAKAVSTVVEKVVQDWDVLGSVDEGSGGSKKGSASLRDVSSWIDQVRDEMEKRSQMGMSRSSALTQFVIPEEEEEGIIQDESINDESADELAKYILDETYDLLESPTFANAERECLDATFSHLHDGGYAKLFAAQNGNGVQSADVGIIPLANVITHLQKTAVSTFYKPPSKKDEIESWGGVFGMMEEPLPSDANVYIPMLERLDAVLELGNVCFD